MINKKLREECRKIVKSYGFPYEVVFYDSKKETGIEIAGQANGVTKKIFIHDKLKTRPEVLGTLFHEMGHVYCFCNGKYKAYHSPIKSKKQFLEKLKQGIRAERYVDKWGQRELSKYDKRIKWHPTYFSKEDVDWYKKEWVPFVLKTWNNRNSL